MVFSHYDTFSGYNVCMEVNFFLELVNTIGFPIAACVAVAFYAKHLDKTNREDMRILRDEHKEEISSMFSILQESNNSIKDLTNATNQLIGEIEVRLPR